MHDRIRIIALAMCCALPGFACDDSPPASDTKKTAANKPKPAPAKTPAEEPDEILEPPDEPEASLDPRVERAATLAKQIETAPENADKILADAGLARDELDAMMFEIAASPELVAQYRVARGL